MKKYHAVPAVTKAWFQNKRLRHKEVQGYTCSGILERKQIRATVGASGPVAAGI